MKNLITIICLIFSIQNVSAEQLMGQLMTNYHHSDGDFHEFVLITVNDTVPLYFENEGHRRTLYRHSGDILLIEGDLDKKIINISDPRDMHPDVDPGFSVSSEETIIEGMNVIQYTIPTLEYKYRGQLEPKYVPEIGNSIYLLKDEMGMNRRFMLSEHEQESFIENYFEKNLEVTCRLIRVDGEDFYFIKSIEVL